MFFHYSCATHDAEAEAARDGLLYAVAQRRRLRAGRFEDAVEDHAEIGPVWDRFWDGVSRYGHLPPSLSIREWIADPLPVVRVIIAPPLQPGPAGSDSGVGE